MEIKSIHQKIFRELPKKAQDNNHSNPFGVNFKGNMISADVFESATKSNAVGSVVNKAANAGKMVKSAIVGSLGDVSTAISTRLNKVVDFGKRVGETASKAWNYLNTKNVRLELPSLDLSMVEKTTKGWFKFTNDRLETKPVGDLKAMLKEGIEAWEAAA